MRTPDNENNNNFHIAKSHFNRIDFICRTLRAPMGNRFCRGMGMKSRIVHGLCQLPTFASRVVYSSQWFSQIMCTHMPRQRYQYPMPNESFSVFNFFFRFFRPVWCAAVRGQNFSSQQLLFLYIPCIIIYSNLSNFRCQADNRPLICHDDCTRSVSVLSSQYINQNKNKKK